MECDGSMCFNDRSGGTTCIEVLQMEQQEMVWENERLTKQLRALGVANIPQMDVLSVGRG